MGSQGPPTPRGSACGVGGQAGGGWVPWREPARRFRGTLCLCLLGAGLQAQRARDGAIWSLVPGAGFLDLIATLANLRCWARQSILYRWPMRRSSNSSIC